MLTKDMSVFVAGHGGMVGSAVVRELTNAGYQNIHTRSRAQLDLLNQKAVMDFFELEKPDCVVLAAAKVGGIHANNEYPAEFIYENLIIQANVINSAFVNDVRQLLFLGSSCIYPKLAEQPMKENSLLTGTLEPTNEPYAIAKIAGIKLCESYNRQYGVDYRCAMPTNLYGPGDNFHLENSHVIPALMRRFHEAKTNAASEVNVWGSGRVKREFLHVEDLARGVRLLMETDRRSLEGIAQPMMSQINIGSGEEVSISELADIVKQVTGFKGKIVFDPSQPDGTPRKFLDISKIKSLGWSPNFTLASGLADTYKWFNSNDKKFRE